ncbi:TRIO and F-actin-binding protein isoform X2 [Alligator mississippiensis]|uniref:TRIO and F-actin-binding protein isoform X2 n=1 Tax=Alligator mississippiensis TaxID=8496 RepID=UPI0009072807|nr:TRIO and F-actin-binding protein isoform X2 [Alligator mississippiensis]
MAESVDNALCEKFEANAFAKHRCQNCYQAAGVHQHNNQAPEEHAVEAPHCDAESGPDPGGPWDPLCILAPRCELYVCARSESRTKSWRESLAYTQFSTKTEDGPRETSTSINTDANTSTGPDTTLSRDWEMTRLLDGILESDKPDMIFTGHLKAIREAALQAERPRWGQTSPSGPWVRVDSQSSVKGVDPLKAESHPMSQTSGSSWPKHRIENGYFSLERRKSEPSQPASPPCASHSPFPSRSDSFGAGRRRTSSASSLNSETSWRTSGGGEGRHGLERQEYTVLADLPKPKRISHKEAFDRGRRSSRTRSPGRDEVEWLFGSERRKTETLEAFQALEEGRVDHLDGKPPQLAKGGRLIRRQSSPTLAREGSKRLPGQLEQQGRGQRESLHSANPAQGSGRDNRSRQDSLRSLSPAQGRDRNWGKQGDPGGSVIQPDRDWRSRAKPVCPMNMDRERVLFQVLNPGKHMDSHGKSRGGSLHPTKPIKTLDASWTGQGGHPRSQSPGRHMESTWKSQKPVHTANPALSPERKGTSPGASLNPLSTGKQRESNCRSLLEKTPPASPETGTDNDRKGRGKPLRPMSPTHLPQKSWKSRGETPPHVSQARRPANDWQSPEKPLCHVNVMQRDWRSPGEHLHAGKQPKSNWKSPVGPVQQSENAWKSPVASPPSKSQRPASPVQQSENNWRNPGGSPPPRSQRPVSPVQRSENDWRSPVGSPSSRSQRPVSPVQRSGNEWKSPEWSPPSRNPEKQWGNEWEAKGNFLHQSQLGRGTMQLLSSARPPSPGSQDLYLDASEKYKPDLLNFKKGWMSILDGPGEWKKHWFVLTDSSLRYYRDSSAEEADELDGEIDLRSCTDVTEYAVQRNYGFQIHMKDAVFTLSAMTSGIRRNWIEALRKNVRPASAPDVTKLSDCNKENSFRSYVPQKSSLRSEEQRSGTGSEVISKGSYRKADGQRQAFDYVELSPLQQGPLNQGSPQRTRGSLRVFDRTFKHEELERDLAVRSEERRKWFEAPDSGVLQTDGPARDLFHKGCEKELMGQSLSEEQRSRLKEEIEKKWLELECLPLRESKRVPLTALLNQSREGHGDTSEALEKEVQSLRAQLESCRVGGESLRDTAKPHGDGSVPQGYISQEACERSLAEMESSHQQVMAELQRHHQRELERLQQEKERLLAEEAAATAAAIEALKKAHQEELNKELGRTRSFQDGGSSSDALQRQHQLDLASLKRELQVLSEQYSQKCLEIGNLTEKAEEREQMLQCCQQEGKELLRQNQDLQARLSEEIGRLRTSIASHGSGDGALHNNERSSCELEVLLRVRENELQYLKKEIQCLREELQMMQKDKRFASGKYQDVYMELNHIKVRSEREIEQLKEHLRLAMAALQEKETLCNSIAE